MRMLGVARQARFASPACSSLQLARCCRVRAEDKQQQKQQQHPWAVHCCCCCCLPLTGQTAIKPCRRTLVSFKSAEMRPGHHPKASMSPGWVRSRIDREVKLQL